MRKIKEVLRLRFEPAQRAIARACSISQSTVHEYLNRAAAVIEAIEPWLGEVESAGSKILDHPHIRASRACLDRQPTSIR
jgi:hypothetical protein